MERRKLVAGNWKMNGTSAHLPEIQLIARGIPDGGSVDVALCLPATLIDRAVRAAPSLPIGGQDVHPAGNGAHTGCISSAMLLDSGGSLTIVGHSERREAQHESDADVRAKAEAAIAAGLRVILCVGESLEVRERGAAVATVSSQLDSSLPGKIERPEDFAVAYEPIWAIGTGKVPTAADIGDMHSALRRRLVAAYGDKGNGVRILYGGSVKPSNADEIFAVPDVDGALVGGASLSAVDFLPIVAAAAG
jgi:triosephosphate isomerase (TIM)